jgi:hypothetical protein
VIVAGGPDGVMSDVERYQFDLQGFLVRRAVLGRGDVAALNAVVDALDLPTPNFSIETQRFSDFLGVATRFRDLIDHPAVLGVVRETCGPNVRLDHAYGIVMRRGTAGLGLHGGAVPFDPAQYYRAEGGRISTGLVAAQWALVDHPPGEGGFVCIPGSHKSAFGVPGGLDPSLVVQVPMHAGDVVIFTEAVVHGTATWQRVEDRRTLLYKYSPGNSAWSGAPWSPELLARCTDRQRQLLQPPSVGGHQPVTG